MADRIGVPAPKPGEVRLIIGDGDTYATVAVRVAAARKHGWDPLIRRALRVLHDRLDAEREAAS